LKLGGGIKNVTGEVSADATEWETSKKNRSHNVRAFSGCKGEGKKGVLYGFHHCGCEGIPSFMALKSGGSDQCLPSESMSTKVRDFGLVVSIRGKADTQGSSSFIRGKTFECCRGAIAVPYGKCGWGFQCILVGPNSFFPFEADKVPKAL
jgi:hypothetical protein